MTGAGKVCAVPGCGEMISDASKTSVCRSHHHWKPYCACIQCREPGHYRGGERVRTREELVALGLLPPDPVFRVPCP